LRCHSNQLDIDIVTDHLNQSLNGPLNMAMVKLSQLDNNNPRDISYTLDWHQWHHNNPLVHDIERWYMMWCLMLHLILVYHHMILLLLLPINNQG
jgi:hypothetical protein